jgi:hypothetical protein
MVKGYLSQIPAIPWRISASANRYPPEGADAPFPLKSWQISGYPKGYPPIQEGHRLQETKQKMEKEKKKWGLNKKTCFLLRALHSRHIF